MPVYRAMKPQDKDKFLVTNLRESYVIDPIKMEREGSITSVLSAGQYTPAVQEAFDKYSSLRDANRFAADEYYGRHAKALEGMYNDIQSGHSPDGAFARRFLQPQGKSKLNKEDLKSAVAQVTSDYNSFLPAWAGGQVLRPDAAREIVNDLSDTIEEFHATGVTVNEATARALHATKLRGREILGGYTWKNGKDQKPLSEYLTMKTGPAKESPIPTDRINDAFKASVDELLYGSDTTHGILPEKAESTQVIRLPDRGGVPMFHVLAHVEGKPYEGVLTGADVFKLASKRKKREGEAIQPASTQMVRDAQQRLDSMK